MFRRPLRRAVVLSLGAVLLVAGSASADSVQADSVTPVVDRTHFLGDVAPGGTVSADVHFVVTCIGLQHIDANQAVVLTDGVGTAPSDGKIVSISTATLSLRPVTTPWAIDGEGCPDPVPSYAGGAESHVVLQAPTTIGLHTFTVAFNRSVSPTRDGDLNPFNRTPTTIDFSMRVVANTPPVLSIGSVPTSPVQGDATDGWIGTWTVSATDAEDDPDPVPTCTSKVGEVLPVGTTTVTCTVRDKAGATDEESFDVTVVDTTPPTFGAFPTDITRATDDPAGRTVEFTTPSATDIVDSSPTVTCAPASGGHFDVGPTTVTCTATDRYGNVRSRDFTVTVTYDPPPPPPPVDTASAVWLEPVAGSGSTFVANRGRTIPVKVRLFVDDRERTTGDASVRVTACGATTGADRPLTWSGGRWNVSLDTSSYAATCYTVEAWIDGLKAGSFNLEMRGDTAAKTAAKRTTVLERSTAPTTKSKPKKSR
ncbi:MAG TPA: HYR domain-containing protein [Candidatus Limnocylindrales bacterium]